MNYHYLLNTNLISHQFFQTTEQPRKDTGFNSLIYNRLNKILSQKASQLKNVWKFTLAFKEKKVRFSYENKGITNYLTKNEDIPITECEF
ncbi:hypothetical protein VMF7928_03307 [Vibrio marisflavi CECT 7928]|uniref:Uncharacterized protein n=1 Tax=Vibrio marisflavi CECT 7928 TaxID=634439 RepID=A0ABN8E7I9_9VIBR|nr:hypothetical protein VMF7928_03307 [Vibrio marisflavi CECT 7928]